MRFLQLLVYHKLESPVGTHAMKRLSGQHHRRSPRSGGSPPPLEPGGRREPRQPSSSAGWEDTCRSTWWPRLSPPAPPNPSRAGRAACHRTLPGRSSSRRGRRSRQDRAALPWAKGPRESGQGCKPGRLASVCPRCIAPSWERVRRALLLKILLIPWKAPS